MYRVSIHDTSSLDQDESRMKHQFMRTRTLAEARAAIARGDVAENSAVRSRMTGRQLSRSDAQFLN